MYRRLLKITIKDNYLMMHGLTLITYLITLLLKKHPIKNDRRFSLRGPTGKVIALLVSIFFNEIWLLKSQIVGLPKGSS